MPDISLVEVNKSFGGSAIKAVSDLSLTIGDGEFMCLLGPSGCGKTTTLRMIAGLENLTSGAISVGDMTVDSIEEGLFVPPEKRGMGLVFQSYALWPHLTVERNTDFGLRLRGIPKQEREERVLHVMQKMGIEQYRDRYPSQLSGGQQQRVALARMLAINPEVLLLDEPLSNLDARLRLEMRAELKRIHSEFGTTVIFVTHDQWEAMTLATSIAVMHEGALQQVGSPDDIYARPANRFVAEFVGSPPINIVEFGSHIQSQLSDLVRDLLAKSGQPRDQAGSIGLRPEKIQLCLSPGQVPDGQFGGSAILVSVLPTGGSWILELDIGGTTLFTTANQPPEFNVGSEIWFYSDWSELHVFDADGNHFPSDNHVAAPAIGNGSDTQKPQRALS
ncbi:MAG: ABC transporter ATP-binding protein [Rhodospirillales bacterium]|jgi:iron(III) transport system ATP-binding protein|nr:ABC transporter ATP-binding protein [Rhodospirillales bacterium]